MHDYSTRNIPLGTQNNRSDLVGARVITLLRQYAPPVVFSNVKTANTLFKTVWTTYYQGCTENASQHSVVGNITAPSTAVAFPYLAYLQVFCLFIFFGKFAFSAGRTVSRESGDIIILKLL